MKKILVIIPAIIIALASTQLMAKKPADAGKAGNFVPVCHKVNHPSQGAYPADKPPKFILWVPQAAVKAHLAHGDVKATITPILDPEGHGRDKATKGKGAFSIPGAFSTTCEEQAASCGDGILDPLNEQCDDGNNLDGDGCSAICEIEAFCGDGVIDPVLGESCDDGVLNSDIDPDACRTNCTLPKCGDGVIDPVLGESCDDGVNDGSSCNPDCTEPS